MTNLKSFAKERNLPWNYFGLQLDFLVHELQSNTRFTPFLEKKNLYEATKFFVYTFESPTNKSYKFTHDRLPKAKEYQKKGIINSSSLNNIITSPKQISN
jgi:Phage tail lysozyme